MKIANFDISTLVFGYFRLDGGSMYGSMPKNLWQKNAPADEENCIKLATRSLVLRGNGRCVLVDLGNGNKWNDKLQRIYAFVNTPPSQLGISPAEVTDIIITHCHFDHLGGICHYKGDKLVLSYPQATVHLQKANFENASNPNLHERASYLPENVGMLKNAELNLIEGSCELFPGIFVHELCGHTEGLQYVEVRDRNQVLLYATDLIPTVHHLPIYITMGYDMWAQKVMEEKEAFLSYAESTDAIVVFEHEVNTPAIKVGRDARGNYAVREVVEI